MYIETITCKSSDEYFSYCCHLNTKLNIHLLLLFLIRFSSNTRYKMGQFWMAVKTYVFVELQKLPLFFIWQWWLQSSYKEIEFKLFIFLPGKWCIFMKIEEGRATLTSLRMSAGHQVPLLIARIHKLNVLLLYMLDS